MKRINDYLAEYIDSKQDTCIQIRKGNEGFIVDQKQLDENCITGEEHCTDDIGGIANTLIKHGLEPDIPTPIDRLNKLRISY